jgi:RIO-like serine/threonine protein kinase
MAAKPTPDESESDRLHDEYKRAKLRYIWAVRELRRQAQAVPHEDFNKFAKYVRETRTETTEAFHALKLFESKHPQKIKTHNLSRRQGGFLAKSGTDTA